MKRKTVITIKEYCGRQSRGVSVESTEIGVTFDEMWASIVRPALIGFGYTESTVDEFVCGPSRSDQSD